MDCKIIKSISEFEEIEDSWREIEKIDKDLSYFSSYDYNYLWWKNNNKSSDSLYVITILHQKKTVAIAPLHIRIIKHKLFSYRQLKFIGFGDSLNCLVDDRNIKKNNCLAEIFKEIEKNYNDWDTIHLTNINSQTKLFQFLKISKYNKATLFFNEMPYFEISELENEKKMKEVLPKSINNLKNKLKKQTTINFRVAKGKEINQTLLNDIIALYGFKQIQLEKEYMRDSRYNLFEAEHNKAFIKQLFEAGNKHIFVFLLESIEGSIISYNIAYEKNNDLISWNTGYNPDYYQYRLNKIRMSYVLDFCVKHKFNRYYWGVGGYTWKFEWTSNFVPIYQLNYLNPQSYNYKKLHIFSKIKQSIAGFKY